MTQSLTLTWSPPRAKLMTVHFLRTDAPAIVCSVDPAAGTFTVSASDVGGPGLGSMMVIVGDIRRVPIANIARAMLTMSMQTYEFALIVQ